jgi:uridine phosphorylase
MDSKDYPILEFDPDKRSIINPSDVITSIDVSEYCVICFFRDIVEKVAKSHNATAVFTDTGVYGTNSFYQFEHEGQPVVFFHPFVGAPMASAFLEIAIGLGCKKFVAYGGAGVLDREILVGDLIVPTAAVRDEGVSYHYVAPGREIDVDKETVDAIATTLKDHGERYRIAKTWTTDAIFRETPSRVKLRRQEGCLTVEMEAAALLAVAQFRNVKLGYILYGGDDVSGDEWDPRRDDSRVSVTEKLFWLSLDACLKL